MSENIKEDIWVLIFQLFNVNWIINNMLSFTKGIIINKWNLKKTELTFKTPCKCCLQITGFSSVLSTLYISLCGCGEYWHEDQQMNYSVWIFVLLE